jgi:aminoglycoside phosphotransferase family enzyme/predicted kinase
LTAKAWDVGSGPAAVRETHIGVVFLVGDRAYKLKKPVDVGFLDFRTKQSRQTVCHREVELNSRLAPDVYLGVAEVSDVDGEPLDYMVVMRRMPDDRRLSTLVHTGAPLTEEIDRLARIIAVFHAAAARSQTISAEGTRDALGARWSASLQQVDTVRGSLLNEHDLAEIRRLTVTFLAGREKLFDSRIAADRIVDGHGDLLADDVFCLDDGPRVLDCLEFDDRLRAVDGLDDIAFLAMDLERLGAPELGATLLDAYVEYSGDPAPTALREHYLAYRAFVRVKVACLRHGQGDVTAADEARQYADIALRHLRNGQVRLVMIGGLPGTGKTTLAGAVADQLGAVLLSTDRLRKELAELAPDEHAPAPYRDGIYTAEHTEATYRELLSRAEKLLALGESVVLDASWTAQSHRELADAVATRTHSRLVPLLCRAPSAITDARIRTRTGTLSDADTVVAARMAVEMDPWPQATVVSTVDSQADSLARAFAAIATPLDRKLRLVT